MSQRAFDAAKDIATKLVETALKVADPTILQDVPLVGTAVKAYDLAKEFKRLHFKQKLKLFINNLDQLSRDEIDSCLEKMNQSNDFKYKVGWTILELERLDDTRKADYSARLFIAYLRAQVDEAAYQALRFALERLYVPDLAELSIFYDKCQTDHRYFGRENDFNALQRLGACGLLMGPSTGFSAPFVYKLNDIGEQFVEFALLPNSGD